LGHLVNELKTAEQKGIAVCQFCIWRIFFGVDFPDFVSQSVLSALSAFSKVFLNADEVVM
jgi:hypothetical protein